VLPRPPAPDAPELPQAPRADDAEEPPASQLAVSTLRDLTEGTFQTVLDDIAVAGAPEAGGVVDRPQERPVVPCSGKIYYALLAGRRERTTDWTAIVRVEQLYPFPYRDLEVILATYPNARQVYWVQEEPWNMGAWHVMYRRLRRIVPEESMLNYVGRSEAASPATGSYKVHQQEEAELVQAAFAR